MSKIKEFWNEHKGEIIVYGGAATAAIASVGLWMLHVKKHTTDLPKPVISGTTVYQFYEQFGERVMNAETTLKDLDAVSKVASDLFGPDSAVYIMIDQDGIMG